MLYTQESLDRINDLNKVNELVSMEFNAGIVTDYKERFKETVASISTTLSDLSSALVRRTSLLEGLGFSGGEIKNEETLTSGNYVALKKVTAYVPEGFSGDLRDYAKVIQKSIECCVVIEREGFEAFSAHMDMLITNVKRLNEYNDNTFGLTNDTLANIDNLNKQVSKFFKHNNHITEVPYGNIVRNNKDFLELVQETNYFSKSINAGDKAGLDPDVVVTLVDKINNDLLKLKKEIEVGKVEDVKPEVINAISRGVLNLAQSAEFYSMTVFRATALVTSVSDTFNNLKKATGGNDLVQ